MTQRIATLSALLLLLITPLRTTAAPDVFSDMSFSKAVKETRNGETVLIIKGTATWCGPCKMMDRDTFRNDRVVNWIEDNAIAIEVDVDRQRTLAKRLKIRSMPTLIAYRDGKEVARKVGYQDASRFLSWVKSVKSKPVVKKDEPKKARRPRSPIELSVSAADLLAKQGRHEDAARNYVSLVERTAGTEPANIDARCRIIAPNMKALAKESREAKAAFRKEHTDVTLALRKREDAETRSTWLVLSNVLNDHRTVRKWVDDATDTTDSKDLQTLAPYFEPSLTHNKAWKTLTTVWASPQDKSSHAAYIAKALPEADQGAAMGSQIAPLFTAYIASNKPEQARLLIDLAAAEVNHPEVWLVPLETATERRQFDPVMTELLDQLSTKSNVPRARLAAVRTKMPQ